MRQVSSRGALRARAPSPGLAGRAGPVSRPLARHEQSTGLFVSGASLLGASEARRGLPARAFACNVGPFASKSNTLVAPTADSFAANHLRLPARQAVPAGGDFPWRRGAQASGRRAQRASLSDLPHLFERSERSERSESCGRPRGESDPPGADRCNRSGRHPPAALRARPRASPAARARRRTIRRWAWTGF